jgi:hypothetical protein
MAERLTMLYGSADKEQLAGLVHEEGHFVPLIHGSS